MMTTLNKQYFTLFTRLMAASVFNAYRHDQPRSERTAKIDGLKDAILRDFKCLCDLVTADEIAQYDQDLGRAAQSLKAGYTAWVDAYWYGATPEEIANATYAVSTLDWEQEMYETIVESATARSWYTAVDHFNDKRKLFGKN